jgi:hypothetical protein
MARFRTVVYAAAAAGALSAMLSGGVARAAPAVEHKEVVSNIWLRGVSASKPCVTVPHSQTLCLPDPTKPLCAFKIIADFERDRDEGGRVGGRFLHIGTQITCQTALVNAATGMRVWRPEQWDGSTPGDKWNPLYVHDFLDSIEGTLPFAGFQDPGAVGWEAECLDSPCMGSPPYTLPDIPCDACNIGPGRLANSQNWFFDGVAHVQFEQPIGELAWADLGNCGAVYEGGWDLMCRAQLAWIVEATPVSNPPPTQLADVPFAPLVPPVGLGTCAVVVASRRRLRRHGGVPGARRRAPSTLTRVRSARVRPSS